MNRETLKEVAEELDGLLRGRFLGRVFQLSPNAMVIDVGLKGEGYLFVSIEPADPRLYLIKRSTRELEKASSSLSLFGQGLRARFGGSSVSTVTMDRDERVVRFSFSVDDELGGTETLRLIAQLTGRSANLFLLDSAGVITHALRAPKGEGQQIGETYRPPTAQSESVSEQPFERGVFPTISAALDAHYRQLESESVFDLRAAKLLAKLRNDEARRKKLKANLAKDLKAHGNPEEHKRLGDLLLANVTSAKRTGNRVALQDYYAEGAPTIEIEVDENSSLQDEAARYFSRYTKSKRAIEEIGTRMVQVERELSVIEEGRANLEAAIETRDLSALEEFEGPKAQAKPSGRKIKPAPGLPGMRRYSSSDGYEVIVGRSARDNDSLTFRVARPNDLWLHAGDYPGSHVIVRNSSRKEIPHRTIVEAAQLAAKFSQASKDSKVTIHYTQRKFLSKPKGSAPGLVRLSSFKTITVEPGENMERMK